MQQPATEQKGAVEEAFESWCESEACLFKKRLQEQDVEGHTTPGAGAGENGSWCGFWVDVGVAWLQDTQLLTLYQIFMMFLATWWRDHDMRQVKEFIGIVSYRLFRMFPRRK